MSDNPFILANLHEGDSCREMVMGDNPLFTQDHYNTIKQLIEETPTLTHVATRIYFRQSSVDYRKITADSNQEFTDKIFDGIFCENTIITPINRNMSPHLASCEIIEKIFNFIKPNLKFH